MNHYSNTAVEVLRSVMIVILALAILAVGVMLFAELAGPALDADGKHPLDEG